MAMAVYLNLFGNCREAIDFYAKAFQLEKSVIMVVCLRTSSASHGR